MNRSNRQVTPFGDAETIDDLNRLNDQQKAIFAEMVAADPGLLEARPAAYLRRWREALNHIEPGSSVLDIGAGWPVARVWDAIFAQGIRYHVADIDAGQIAACKAQLAARGQSADNAIQTPNTVLPFPSASMDFVFSSHCLEHSTDLAMTFGEIRRVLKPKGGLFFSVPFGFDDSEEHLLFLGINEWLQVCEAAGFVVRGWTVGRTYSEGWDLSVLCEARSDIDLATISHIDRQFHKAGRRLLPHDDPSIVYEEPVRQPPFTISQSFQIRRPAAYLLMLRHRWSGVARLTDARGTTRTIDLFERADHIGAIDVSGFAAPIRVEIVGRNPVAQADQAVVFGLLVS